MESIGTIYKQSLYIYTLGLIHKTSVRPCKEKGLEQTYYIYEDYPTEAREANFSLYNVHPMQISRATQGRDFQNDVCDINISRGRGK